MSREVVVVEGVRTPYAKAGTELKDVPAADLARIAVTELLARTDFDPAALDEVIFGNIAQPPDAVNVSRVAALKAGVPERVPAFTVNRLCGSGLESIAEASYRIAAGDAEAIVAGGVESMSRIPLLYSYDSQEVFTEVFTAKDLGGRLAAASKFRPRHFKPEIGLQMGLTDAVCGLNMGETAEVLAREHKISREEQDAFALQSHQRAIAARERLREEIVPVYPAPGYAAVRDDVGPRDGQTIEALAKLKPYFDRKNGSVTVGNSCQVTDGAAAILVGDEETANGWGTPPLGRIRSFAFAGLNPGRMGLGPVFAMAKALAKAQVKLTEIEVFEINEAFAAQVLACLEAAKSESFARAELGQDKPLGEIPMERLNVNGGAIALGHPVGSSGARLLITTLHEMRRRGARLGLASLCVGGGQGAAFVLERA